MTPIASRRTPLAAALCAVLLVASTDATTAPSRGHVVSGSPLAVTNCNDAGPGSLRDAIANAVNQDEIDLRGLSCSSITLTTGALAVGVDNLEVVAAGGTPRPAAITSAGNVTTGYYELHIVTIDGGGSDRVFDHAGTGHLELQGFALRNGYANGNGGCVRSAGGVDLIMTTVSGCHAHDSDYNHGRGGGVFATTDFHAWGSTISGNRADGQAPRGGGVFASHDLTLYSTQVTGNAASGYQSAGGGVFAGHFLAVQQSTISANTALGDRPNGEGIVGGAYARNNVVLFESTISGNSADDVGGLFVVDKDTVSSLASAIEESTISGNEGRRAGGALMSAAPLWVYNSTIADNTAQAGGTGGLSIGANDRFFSSIIAANTAAGAPSDIGLRNGAPSTTTITGDHNLIVASTITPPADTIAQTPLLAPLASNGGPTQTHALLPGSPAIDHGTNPDNASHDQRGSGYARVVGTSADIGAFESGAGPDGIFFDGFDGTVSS